MKHKNNSRERTVRCDRLLFSIEEQPFSILPRRLLSVYALDRPRKFSFEKTSLAHAPSFERLSNDHTNVSGEARWRPQEVRRRGSSLSDAYDAAQLPPVSPVLVGGSTVLAREQAALRRRRASSDARNLLHAPPHCARSTTDIDTDDDDEAQSLDERDAMRRRRSSSRSTLVERIAAVASRRNAEAAAARAAQPPEEGGSTSKRQCSAHGRRERTHVESLASSSGAALRAVHTGEISVSGMEMRATCLAGMPGALHLLLRRHDPNEVVNGERPIHWAATGGDLECVQILVEAGAALDAKDAFGRTALHLATFKGHDTRVVKALLDAGCDVDARDAGGATALHLACSHGAQDLAATLAHAACDVHARDAAGRTARDLATALGYDHLADKLAQLERQRRPNNHEPPRPRRSRGEPEPHAARQDGVLPPARHQLHPDQTDHAASAPFAAAAEPTGDLIAKLEDVLSTLRLGKGDALDSLVGCLHTQLRPT